MKQWTFYLHKNGEDINYGNLTDIIPITKTRVIKVNGKLKRVEKSVEEIDNENEQFKERIVRELNDLLPNVCIKQKTMYYYAKEC